MKVPDELFQESDGVGSFNSHTIRYRYDDDEILIVGWKFTSLPDFASIARALAKRHPGKPILLSEHSVDDRTNLSLQERDAVEFHRLMFKALKMLGVSGEQLERVGGSGGMGSDYRETLHNAASYGERFLVGKSLMQHHNPSGILPDYYWMDTLADELVMTTRAVSFSTRYGGDRGRTLRIAVKGLRAAIAGVREARLARAVR